MKFILGNTEKIKKNTQNFGKHLVRVAKKSVKKPSENVADCKKSTFPTQVWVFSAFLPSGHSFGMATKSKGFPISCSKYFSDVCLSPVSLDILCTPRLES